ncbi:hypothetical protein ACIA5E_15420 [Nocardia asteroides]|uniref:hypothetical protein n=1 Tax=Nocardia asteroides TaxID=1824 RepID=UPI003792654C
MSSDSPDAGMRDEWWHTPGSGPMYAPAVSGYSQPDPDGARTGLRQPGNQPTQLGILLDRITVAVAILLAGYAVMAVVIGFKASTRFPGHEWMNHRILSVTALHMFAAVLWMAAAVMLGLRVGRLLVGVLTVVYLGVNVAGVGGRWWDEDWALSIFTGMVDYVCVDTGWAVCPPDGIDAGLRFVGAGALLAGLMLVLLLASAVATRRRGGAGHSGGQSGRHPGLGHGSGYS